MLNSLRTSYLSRSRVLVYLTSASTTCLACSFRRLKKTINTSLRL
jgi:hypothetical protein